MKPRVHYEWVVETLEAAPVGEYGEPQIVDVDYRDRLADFDGDTLRAALDARDVSFRLALVRDVHDEVEGLQDRSWAYVDETGLPARFDYCPGRAMPVPKRFAPELARVVADLAKAGAQ